MLKKLINDLAKQITFKTSRSSGSGGQHVNKVSTKVELRLDIEAADELSDEEKDQIKKVLANRINKEGVLSIVVDASRSQALNRKAAVRKFKELIELALTPKKKRKGPPKLHGNPKKRLADKKRRSEVKAGRKKVDLTKD